MSEINGKLEWPTPKTHQARDVSIPRYLADLLAEEIAGKAPGDLPLCSPEGAPLRHGNLHHRVWDPAVAATGLTGLDRTGWTQRFLKLPRPQRGLAPTPKSSRCPI